MKVRIDSSLRVRRSFIDGQRVAADPRHMRIRPDPTVSRYEHHAEPRAALVAAMQRERRLRWRTLTISTAVCVAAGLAYTSGRIWAEVAGLLLWVGFFGVIGILSSLYEMFVLSERRRGVWQAAKIEECFVWKTTDVRDSDDDVTETLLFVLLRAPRRGERVADPHALGKQKHISGPEVLIPELVRVGGKLNRMEYLGRTIILATSEDGRVMVMMPPIMVSGSSRPSCVAARAGGVDVGAGWCTRRGAGGRQGAPLPEKRHGVPPA